MSVLASYWGKARAPEQAGVSFHPFACHSLDVVAVADCWLCASAVLARSLCGGQHVDLARAWVLFFLGLHDLGKLDQRFQAKAPDVLRELAPERAQRLSRVPPNFTRYDHGAAGYRWALAEVHIYVGASSQENESLDAYWESWRPWLAAVTGHHGVLPKESHRPEAIAIPRLLCEADREARTQWVAVLEAMCLAPVGASLKDLPPAAPSLLPGFCSVADWLGSNTDYFPYRRQPADLNQYVNDRAEAARSILRASGLVSKPTGRGGMSELFPARTPRQVQTLVDQVPRVPGLTLVEAPTGSGKTEAALSYAAHLLAAGLADSIVFALPTQATANAMLRRLQDVASRLFPAADANVVLAHGKSRYNPEFIALRRAAHPATVQHKDEALVQCAEWLSQSRKRAFLGQIGVCTVDQVLLSVLPVRHNFVRSLGIGRSVLIVDEVHAYDSYMYGLLEDVLRRQRCAGGCAVLLSATLPHIQRSRLARAWSSDGELDTLSPYPLLTHVDAYGKIRTFRPDDDHQPEPRSVAVELLATVSALPNDDLSSRILAAARAGARIAVICNLVDHAQRLARSLREMANDVPVDLFHARYRFCDRQRRERTVLDTYGPAEVLSDGRVLVATQVVEQSLDLDFDWLVTQLCPADLLFQRLGRLHRHERPRPVGFQEPQVCVLLPQEADFGPHKFIYDNVRVLWRTRELLASAPRIDFPTAYRSWIERVYCEDDWPDEPENIIEAADKWRVKQCVARHDAQQLASGEATAYDDDARIQIFTRDGEMSLTVLPLLDGALFDGRRLDGLEDWELAEVINQHCVAVPAGWKDFLPAPDDGIYQLAMREAESGYVTELDRVRLVYSVEYGMEKQTL